MNLLSFPTTQGELRRLQHMKAEHNLKVKSLQFENQQKLKHCADRYHDQIAQVEHTHTRWMNDVCKKKLQSAKCQIKALEDDLHAKQRDQTLNNNQSNEVLYALQRKNERIRNESHRVVKKMEQYNARLSEARNKVFELEKAVAKTQKQQKMQYIRRVNNQLNEQDWRTFLAQIECLTSRSARDKAQKEAHVERIKTSLDEVFARYPKKLKMRDGFEMMFDDNFEKQLFQTKNVESDRKERILANHTTESRRNDLRIKTKTDTKANQVKVKMCATEPVKYQTRASCRHPSPINQINVPSRTQSDRSTRKTASPINQRLPNSIEYRAASKTASPINQHVPSSAQSDRTASNSAIDSLPVEQQGTVSVNSVLCYDSNRKHREAIQAIIQLDEDCMTIGSRTFRFSDIHSLRIGDASLSEGNADPDCCVTIVSSNGIFMIEASSMKKRDFWVNAIKTLSIASAKRNEHKQEMTAQRRRSKCYESLIPSMTRFGEKTKNHIHQYTRMQDDVQPQHHTAA